MLPYIDLPDLKLGPIPIHVFGILVAIGVLVGIWLARRRAKFMGVDPEKLESLINWMLLIGFICAHVIDEIFYHPDEIARNPLSLLLIWEGIGSFGGWIGAALGILLWKKFKSPGTKLLPYADLICSVLPVAWIFGRLGCATVHDHKGALAAAPNILTVAFPDGPHYDLGLLEMLYTIVIAGVCAALWRKKRAPGLYIGLVCVMYAPVRFVLDFLRLDVGATGDKRYLSLTFAQYACVVMLVYGVYMLLRARRLARSSAA